MNSVYSNFSANVFTLACFLDGKFKQRVIITEYKILESAQVVLWYCPHPLPA